MKTTQNNNENLNAGETFKSACLASCQKLVAQIEQTKNNIVAEFCDAFAAHEQLLQLAIKEADALAWQTAYPHLVFPLLATEKVQTAARWSARQKFLHHDTADYALAA